MIRKKLLFSTFILLVFATASFFVYSFNYASHRYTANSEAVIDIDSNVLVNAYLSDELNANNLYTNKFIKISGTLKKITFLNNRNTLILRTSNSGSGIICDIDATEKYKLMNLKKDQKIAVKGICKGFLKDVILLNCYIETNE